MSAGMCGTEPHSIRCPHGNGITALSAYMCNNEPHRIRNQQTMA